MKKWSSLTVAFTVLAGLTFAGCREQMPHAFTWPYSGDQNPSHPKPPEGGYYSDWDPYAGTIELEPATDLNPVKTQHILIATVKDKDGKPLPNRRVEWIISSGSVGDIVEVDESGFRASRGYKVDNHFAVSHTNNYSHTLTRGNEDPSDDVQLTEGQTWCVITSPVEGDTFITAYCPGIYDWNKHKAFAVKQWYDVAWDCPPAAVNIIGTNHELVFKLYKFSDGSPLANHNVTFTVEGSPTSGFATGGNTAVVKTDSAGLAKVTLNSPPPDPAGKDIVNTIHITIVRPEDIQCCLPAKTLGACDTTKTWQHPHIDIAKTAPAQVVCNEQFTYTIVVSNPSNTDVTNVQVNDQLPGGTTYVSSNPPATVNGNTVSWTFDKVSAQRKRTLTITVTATAREGTLHNCARVIADKELSGEACADTTVSCPALACTIECSGITVCDPIPIAVSVTNTAGGRASNVKVQVDLPSGMTADNGRNSLTFDAGTLNAGETKRANFNAKASAKGSYTVTANATGDGGLTCTSSCTASVTQPVLQLTKTSTRDKQFLNKTAEFQITVTNTGDTAARDTVVVDTMPAGMQFISATEGGQASGGTVRWSLGTMEPGASKTVAVTVKASTEGTMKNTATVQAFCANADGASQIMVEGIPAILLEVVDVNDPIEIGQNEIYEITVTNQGSKPDTNIVIKCFLPPQQDYVTAQGPTEVSVSGKEITFAPLPSLAPKQRATFRVTAKATGEGDIRFKTTMDSDVLEGVVEETESTHQY